MANEGSQFPNGEASIDQFFRQMTPDTQGGGAGWPTAKYTDHIAAIQATAAWQGMRQACYDFADAYTAKGGVSEVIDLPKEGITGNDHFIFQDLNNDVVADHVENWIQEFKICPLPNDRFLHLSIRERAYELGRLPGF